MSNPLNIHLIIPQLPQNKIKINFLENLEKFYLHKAAAASKQVHKKFFYLKSFYFICCRRDFSREENSCIFQALKLATHQLYSICIKT